MRRDDWQPRLWSELQAAEHRPFAWGVHDCIRLTARCLDAMLLDAHYLALAASLYSDQRTGLRLLKSRGGLDPFVSEHFGAALPRNLARQGDVVAADLETGPAIGICTGPRFAVASDGVLYLPLSLVRAAWRVE